MAEIWFPEPLHEESRSGNKSSVKRPTNVALAFNIYFSSYPNAFWVINVFGRSKIIAKMHFQLLSGCANWKWRHHPIGRFWLSAVHPLTLDPSHFFSGSKVIGNFHFGWNLPNQSKFGYLGKEWHRLNYHGDRYRNFWDQGPIIYRSANLWDTLVLEKLKWA